MINDIFGWSHNQIFARIIYVDILSALFVAGLTRISVHKVDNRSFDIFGIDQKKESRIIGALLDQFITEISQDWIIPAHRLDIKRIEWQQKV